MKHLSCVLKCDKLSWLTLLEHRMSIVPLMTLLAACQTSLISDLNPFEQVDKGASSDKAGEDTADDDRPNVANGGPQVVDSGLSDAPLVHTVAIVLPEPDYVAQVDGLFDVRFELLDKEDGLLSEYRPTSPTLFAFMCGAESEPMHLYAPDGAPFPVIEFDGQNPVTVSVSAATECDSGYLLLTGFLYPEQLLDAKSEALSVAVN